MGFQGLAALVIGGLLILLGVYVVFRVFLKSRVPSEKKWWWERRDP